MGDGQSGWKKEDGRGAGFFRPGRKVVATTIEGERRES